jgi:hypothetical protein
VSTVVGRGSRHSEVSYDVLRIVSKAQKHGVRYSGGNCLESDNSS